MQESQVPPLPQSLTSRCCDSALARRAGCELTGAGSVLGSPGLGVSWHLPVLQLQGRNPACSAMRGGPPTQPTPQSHSAISTQQAQSCPYFPPHPPPQLAPSQQSTPASVQQPKPQTFAFKDSLTSLSLPSPYTQPIIKS